MWPFPPFVMSIMVCWLSWEREKRDANLHASLCDMGALWLFFLHQDPGAIVLQQHTAPIPWLFYTLALIYTKTFKSSNVFKPGRAHYNNNNVGNVTTTVSVFKRTLRKVQNKAFALHSVKLIQSLSSFLCVCVLFVVIIIISFDFFSPPNWGLKSHLPFYVRAWNIYWVEHTIQCLLRRKSNLTK